MKFERLVKFENIVYEIIQKQQRLKNKLMEEHPRSYKKLNEYKKAEVKCDKAHNVRSKIYDKTVKAANAYVENFLPKPLFVDISHEEFKKLPIGEKIARRCAYVTRENFSNILEIGEIIDEDNVQSFVEAIERAGLKKVAVTDRSTALMMVLMGFIENGWKVVGKYERELPHVDKKIVNYSYYRLEKAEGLLLVKE